MSTVGSCPKMKIEKKSVEKGIKNKLKASNKKVVVITLRFTIRLSRLREIADRERSVESCRNRHLKGKQAGKETDRDTDENRTKERNSEWKKTN